MKRKDKEALDLAMQYAGRDHMRASQLASMLKGGNVPGDPPRPWQEVAEFAAYCAQSKSLHLRPWEDPPCVVDENDDGPAAELLRKMLAAGVSRYHPDPLTVLGRVLTNRHHLSRHGECLLRPQ